MSRLLYPAPPNPYRASTGSMPVPIIKTDNGRNAVTGHYVEECSSCGSSFSDENTIPLNTPYTTPPSLGTIPRVETRRVSNSSEKHPVVVTANLAIPTNTPSSGQVLHRYHNGALVYEPASSISPRKDRRERRNSVSSSHPRTYLHHHIEERPHRRPGHEAPGEWHTYQHEIDIRDEKQGSRGRTRIPRRLVNKEAVQESGLHWEEERGTGALVIFKALSRHSIERLVKRTESIRAHRREKVVRIIPEPTKTAIIHQSDAYSDEVRRSRERIMRAEERAQEADEKARRKEYRAEVSGSYGDEMKARRARAEADQKARDAEDMIIKEQRRREDREKSYGHGTAVKVAKSPREIVIVR